LIVLNFTGQPRTFEDGGLHGRIILTTALDRTNEPVTEKLRLGADEGVIIEIDHQTFKQP
jgi:hypothetical protein